MAISDKKLFELDVIKRLDKAEKRIHHSFPGMRKLIRIHGAVKAAKNFIDPKKLGKLSPGLRMLVNANLSNLTIEQAVIDFQRKGLFSEQDVLVAKAHLIMAKMLAKMDKGKPQTQKGGDGAVVPFGTGTSVA
jgi:hypothetical protein